MKWLARLGESIGDFFFPERENAELGWAVKYAVKRGREIGLTDAVNTLNRRAQLERDAGNPLSSIALNMATLELIKALEDLR